MDVYHIAVRKTDGREWFDSSTIDLLRDEARRKASQTDKKIPGWAKHNPVVRVARVSILENDVVEKLRAALEWASRSFHHPECPVAKGKSLTCNCHVEACRTALAKIS